MAAPSISYSGTPFSWTYNVDIGTVSVTNTGGSVTSYAVNSGTLPTGVSLNTTTGDITGTPTVAKVAANVVIRATGPGGTADATINIEVPSPLYTSLVDYWNLDEASGTRVGSHAGLDLTDNNTVTQATGVGGVGTAAQFTAANSESLSRASPEDGIRGASGVFSRALWVKTSTAGLQIFVEMRNGNSKGYRIKMTLGGNAAFGVSNGTTEFTANAAAPASGSWALLYCDFDGSTVRISVNNGTLATAAFTGTYDSNPGATFRVGRDGIGAGIFVNGDVQSLGAWERTLTAAERTWLYNAAASARLYSALATYDGG